MESLVIGEGSASIHQVAKVIENSTSFAQLLTNWRRFSQYLEVCETAILELERKYHFGHYQLRDIPRELLSIWKSEKGKKATLNVLFEALTSCELSSIADTLKEKLSQVYLAHPPELPKYYIEREFEYKRKLDENIFLSPSVITHIFLVKGIDKSLLAKATGYRSIDYSGNQLRKIDVQYIILLQNEDIEKICKNTTQPVHVIEFKSGFFFWVKSTAGLDIVKRFIKPEGKTVIDENEIVAKIVFLPSPSAVSIADSPGMGKSLVLASLAKKIKHSEPNCLVIFIELLEFVSKLDKNPQPSAIEAVSSIATMDEKTRCIFQKQMRDKKYQIYLFLDAYDEIRPDKMNLVDIFLQECQQLVNFKLVVTTRLHFQSKLEGILKQISVQLRPFDDTNQHEFLRNYWIQKEAKEGPTLDEFTKKCLQLVKTKETDSDKEIAGTPLRCMLLAEVYVEDVKRACRLETKWEGNIDQLSFVDIYEQVIERKLSKYTRIFAQNLTSEYRQKLLNTHVYFAIQLLFPTWVEKFGPYLDGKDVEIDELFSVGLVEKSANNTTRFIHRTIAEYLLARFIVSEIRNFELSWEMLVGEVLGSFHDIDALQFNYVLKYPVIAYFANACLYRSNFELEISQIQNFDNITEEQLCIATVSCCTNDLEYCYDVTISALGLANIRDRLDLRDKYFKDLPHAVIIKSKNLSLLQKVLNFTREKFGANLGYHTLTTDVILTPVHTAIREGHFNSVSYLVDTFRDDIISMNHLLHHCVKLSANDSKHVILDKLLIINMLEKINHSWLYEHDEQDRSPILSPNIHIKLLERLVELGADINSSSQAGTILHSDYEKTEYYKDKVNWALENGYKIIDHRDHLGRNLLMHIFDEKHNKSLDDDAILELLYKGGVDINGEDNSGNSVLFHCILRTDESGNIFHLIRKVVDLGARLNHVNTFQQNAAHVTVCNVKDPVKVIGVLDLLVSKGFNGINGRDSHGRVPLMYAIQHCCLENFTDKLFDFFKRAGANFNSEDDNGESVLFVAIERAKLKPHCVDMVAKILNIGGSIIHRNKYSENAAHVTVRVDSSSDPDPDVVLNVLNMLKRKGFSGFDQKDSTGSTPLDLSMKWQSPNMSIVEYLKAETHAPCKEDFKTDTITSEQGNNCGTSFDDQTLTSDQDNDIKFLTKYWVSEYGTSERVGLNEFAFECLQAVESAFNDREKEMVDTLLRRVLIAEVYADGAKQVLTSEHLLKTPIKKNFVF